VGLASWVALTDGYAAGKGIIGLSDGKWEQNDVWNLLSLLPIAGPLLGSASRGVTAMRAANRGGTVGSAANTTGRQIDQVARELTEVTTKVETGGGSPAPNVAPDPLPGQSNDPVPTSPSQPTGCFIAGTDILTPEGMKDIETIQVGDFVIADDPNTPGEIEARRVVETYIRQVTSLIDVYIDGQIITTTDEHPFWVPELGWVKAKDLQEGTLVQTDYETFLDIDKVVRREGDFTVYNFQVEEFHSYFVSELGILVHNNCQFPLKKLQHEYKHAPDFGVNGDWNKVNGEAFKLALEDHMANAPVVMEGTYRGTQQVTHYYNPSTNLWSAVDTNNQLVAAWQLSEAQISHLLSDGNVQ
jgi:Pretoxin HINT domain/Colicin D